jgi:hypothetical protein
VGKPEGMNHLKVLGIDERVTLNGSARKRLEFGLG